MHVPDRFYQGRVNMPEPTGSGPVCLRIADAMKSVIIRLIAQPENSKNTGRGARQRIGSVLLAHSVPQRSSEPAPVIADMRKPVCPTGPAFRMPLFPYHATARNQIPFR